MRFPIELAYLAFQKGREARQEAAGWFAVGSASMAAGWERRAGVATRACAARRSVRQARGPMVGATLTRYDALR